MPKNILIFSDGTGQAGGLKPDQQLSNIYKLYRAARTGPDSEIDPAQQIAFYDAGLGTAKDEGTVPIRALQFIRKFISASIGFGISRNIADCYEAILKYYEPGDRIFLFGFSRGAYTARCVGGVLQLCGVPLKLPDGESIPRYGKALRAIAEEAVSKVYEHGAGRDRDKFAAERDEQARRFRQKYSCEIDGQSNVVPHFIGVFDTVAALGASGAKRFGMNSIIVGFALLLSWVTAHILTLFSDSFWVGFWTVLIGGTVAFSIPLLRSSFKIISNYPVPGQFRWHFAGWRSGFYDKTLDNRVRYARHALAIDETRKDFARVPWGLKSDHPVYAPEEPEWFQQIWFAGNHSDIGGSYAEEDSRLSDISLTWMLEAITVIPTPVIVDEAKLNLFPAPAGMQHSEVMALLDKYPSWWPHGLRFIWKEQPRVEVSGAPLHESVLARFKLPAVLHYDRMQPYRPETLRHDPQVAYYYENIDSSAAAIVNPRTAH